MPAAANATHAFIIIIIIIIIKELVKVALDI